MSISVLESVTDGIEFTWTVKIELVVLHPFAPVPITFKAFEPAAKLGLKVWETWAKPWDTLLANNSYVEQLALVNVIGSPKQIVLSGSFENRGTVGKLNTVNVRAELTGQVFDVPVTLTVWPFIKDEVVNVFVAELEPCDTPFTKNW